MCSVFALGHMCLIVVVVSCHVIWGAHHDGWPAGWALGLGRRRGGGQGPPFSKLRPEEAKFEGKTTRRSEAIYKGEGKIPAGQNFLPSRPGRTARAESAEQRLVCRVWWRWRWWCGCVVVVGGWQWW